MRSPDPFRPSGPSRRDSPVQKIPAKQRDFRAHLGQKVRNGIVEWRRECQSIPLDLQAVFHFSTWEPTVLATSHWLIRCAPKPPRHLHRSGRGCRPGHLRVVGNALKTVNRLIAANGFLGLRAVLRKTILAVSFRRSASSRMPCEEEPSVSYFLFFQIGP
jgi:hypothetical protein